MEWVGSIAHIDRRVMYTLLIVMLLIPLINPIGLPLSISSDVRSAYETIEALQKGAVVILSTDYSAGASPELWPQTVAYTKHLMKKGARIIALSWWAEGVMYAEKVMKENAPKYGYQYGVDYVILPYKAGQETAVAALGRDLKGLYSEDFYGTPISRIPLLTQLSGIKDVSLIVSFATGDDLENYVKQIQKPYGIPMVAGVTAVKYAQCVPYVQSKQLRGLLGGLRGAAEYEKLIGEPGRGLVGMDAQSMAHLYVIILIILGNIGYFTSRKRELAKGAGSDD